MSIIEKAVRRINASSPSGDQVKGRNAAQASWGGQPGAWDQNNTMQRSLAETEPALTLDYARLKRKGVLASGDMVARASDEFRRIKRPLLAHIANSGSRAAASGNLIMVTSSIAGEGKTHTAINLALNMARDLDYTILLVDADVIKRETSELLGIKDRAGLTDLLHNDNLEIGDTLLRTDVSRLVVLPAGKRYDHATELLSSNRMRRLVSELSSRYAERIIIFDSPPLLAAAEAQAVAQLMDQIVLVVEAYRTPQSAVEEAVASLDDSKPIGLVLSKNRRMVGAADHYAGYHVP